MSQSASTQFYIHKAMVLKKRTRTESLTLWTNLPKLNFFGSDEDTTITIDVPAGTGEQYCKKVFGIDPEVVDMGPFEYKFSKPSP